MHSANVWFRTARPLIYREDNRWFIVKLTSTLTVTVSILKIPLAADWSPYVMENFFPLAIYVDDADDVYLLNWPTTSTEQRLYTRSEANADTTYCRQTNTCLMVPRDRTNPCRNWWETVDLVCRCRWFHRSMSTREMCWETWSVRKNKKLHQLRWQDFRKRSSWQQQLCRRLMISCYILWRWFAKQCSCELLKSVIVHEW